MSIIYEALKKVEKSIDKNQDAAHSAEVESKPQGVEKSPSPSFSRSKKTVLLFIVAGLGAWCAALAFSFFTRQMAERKQAEGELMRMQGLPQKPPESALPKSVSIPPSAVPTVPNPQEGFVLNGVFFADGQGYALINNQIFEESDTLAGAKVKRISLEGVELETGEGEVHFLSNKK